MTTATDALAQLALPDEPDTWTNFDPPAGVHTLQARASLHATDFALLPSDLGRRVRVSYDPQGVLQLEAPGGPFRLRRLALRGLTRRLGVALRPCDPVLAVQRLQEALARHGRALLLRVVGGEVRAVLGSGYGPVDNATIGAELVRAAERLGASLCVRGFGSGLRTLVRLTMPSAPRSVRIGDVVERGVDVANSEVGLGALRIVPVVHRLACSNGMRIVDARRGWRLVHVGDPDRLAAELTSHVEAALQATLSAVDRFAHASRVRVASQESVADELIDIGFSPTAAQRILDQATDDAGDTAITRMDVANAVTWIAQSCPRHSRRARLEELAYRYLVRG